jgi:hypothetical protein
MSERLGESAKGSARPEGGREAPALGGGSGAARCRAPGGEDERWWRLGPVVGGVVFSVLIFGLFGFAALHEACIEEFGGAIQCEARWQLLATAPFNEIGDTLAGFAGALAFVWLIVAVLIQGRELAAQRAELRLTRIEFREQRLASQEMAKAMSAQAEIFQDEKRRRQEQRAEEELNERLRNLANLPNEISLPTWKVTTPHATGGASVTQFGFLRDVAANEDPEKMSSYLLHAMLEDFRRLRHAMGSNAKVERPQRDDDIQILQDRLVGILGLTQSLSEAQRLRVERLKVKEAYETVQSVVASDWWASQ